MIKLELTTAEVDAILFLIADYKDSSDYLDILYNTVATQFRAQEN